MNISWYCFLASLSIPRKTKLMLAALPVQWHCFQSGKVSWFTSSPAQCLLFPEMFTNLPSTLTFQAHKRRRKPRGLDFRLRMRKNLSEDKLHRFSCICPSITRMWAQNSTKIECSGGWWTTAYISLMSICKGPHTYREIRENTHCTNWVWSLHEI